MASITKLFSGSGDKPISIGEVLYSVGEDQYRVSIGDQEVQAHSTIDKTLGAGDRVILTQVDGRRYIISKTGMISKANELKEVIRDG